MKFAFISEKKVAFPVAVLCRVLGVSSSGYYASLGAAAVIKPLQRMWSPQGHRVESRCRLGGAHTA